MLPIEQIQSILKEKLSLHRYHHSLRVQETAEKLAKIYNVSIEKASIAGLVHDCAKDLSDDELLKYAIEFGILIDDIFYYQRQLLHGIVSMELAKMEFKIEDEEILNAIRFHTTGRENMSTLEKIVFIADYIEPGRTFKEVEQLRKEAFSNLDLACLMAMDNTIRYVLSKGDLLHPLTVEARNFILLQRKAASR